MHLGISLKQIETFYWIARLGSFSEAAGQLNTTQPAISNRIRELEGFLGSQLFTRSGRTVSLTPTGRDLLELAERFIELTDEFLVRARSSGGISGVLRIGAADTIALTWLPRLVAELSRLYPQLYVELFVDLSVNIQDKLIEGDLDIGFLVGSAPSPDFVEVPLGSVSNCWMCAPRLGLSGRKITPVELAVMPILTHSRGSHLYRVVRKWFAGAGVRRLRIHGCSSLASMIEMTVAGLGVSVLPPVMIRERYGPDRLQEIVAEPALPPTDFTCVYADKAPSMIYQKTIEIARREIEVEPCFQLSRIDG